jgi:hypothetical protein
MVESLKKDPKRIHITFSGAEAERLRHEYKDFPDVVDRIMSWEEYHKRATVNIDHIAIDNADYILQNLVRHPIKEISIEKK